MIPHLHHKSVHLICMSVLSSTLLACSSLGVPVLDNAIRASNSPTFQTERLNVNNASRLQHITTLDSNSHQPVAALHFDDDSQLLKAVDISGTLYHWQVISGTLFSRFSVGPISINATIIDDSGDLLITASGKTPKAVDAGYASNVSGARIWDANTGFLLQDITSRYLNELADISISPNGRFLTGVRDSGLQTWNASTGKLISSSVIGDLDSTTFNRIDVVTYDATSNYVATASANGSIRVDERKDGSQANESWRVEDPKQNHQGFPLAIAFSPTNEWLVVIIDNQMKVIRRGARYAEHFHSIVSSTIGPSASLAFDPMGQLLAIGTVDGWQIWDINKKKMLISSSASPVYALTFSRDGHLFAYGDVNGEIQVWGVLR